MKSERSSKKSDATRFVVTFVGAALFALLVVVALVTTYGASGTYLFKQVVLDPSLLEEAPSKGTPFVSNKIEFVLADKLGKQWGRYAVSVASYRAFYHKVKNVRSIPKLNDRLVGQFALVASSTLTLFVQKEGKDLFSQIEFLDEGDAFRVRRPADLETDLEWIYFYYPGIYKTVTELFAPQGDL